MESGSRYVWGEKKKKRDGSWLQKKTSRRRDKESSRYLKNRSRGMWNKMEEQKGESCLGK